MKYCIYKIVSENTDLVYVGNTTQKYLSNRFSTHNVQYRRYIKGLTKLWVSSFKVLEHGNCKCEMIEQTDDSSREMFWIKELNACNTKKLGLGKSGCPIKKKEWAEKNKEHLKEYKKTYREKNRQKLRDNQKTKKKCPHCNKMISGTNLKRHIKSIHYAFHSTTRDQ